MNIPKHKALNGAEITELFMQLYQVHEVIEVINEKISNIRKSVELVESFTDEKSEVVNVTRIETDISIKELEIIARIALEHRARFDAFVCELNPKLRQMLSLRCEKRKQWKEVATILNFTQGTLRGWFGDICEKAIEAGICDLISNQKVQLLSVTDVMHRPSQLIKAEAFLIEHLAEGEKKLKELIKIAQERGISRKTLERARGTVNAFVSRKEGRECFIALPKEGE